MAIILVVLFALLSIANLVVFIIVLIKQFKEGALKGVLGIITCGIYTFVWGWIKHKQLRITKMMLVWTGTIVIPFILQIVVLVTGLGMSMMDVADMMSVKAPPSAPQVVQKRVTRPDAQKSPQPQPAKTADKQGPVPAKNPLPKGTVNYLLEMKKVENLLKLDDKNSDAYYNRGWLHEYKGDLESAEKDYSRAIELDKKNKDTYFNRGLLYVKMKRYDQAIDDFSAVLKRQPRSAAALCNRGNAHFQKGNLELALKDYTAALESAPEDGDLYYNRGLVYLAKQDKEKAMADFRKAVELGHPEAGAYLASPSPKPASPEALKP